MTCRPLRCRDILQGGTGNAKLYGQDGADVFVFRVDDADGTPQVDIIADFDLRADVIDLAEYGYADITDITFTSANKYGLKFELAEDVSVRLTGMDFSTFNPTVDERNMFAFA